MATCEKCGKEFEEWDAENKFYDDCGYSPLPLSYSQFGRALCGDCAVEEFENGNYYETCECCGKQFNPNTEHSDFENQVSHRVLDADMYEHGIYCADCATKKLLDSLSENEEADEQTDDEALSVYDAALIWASHGKDEDYMFGYSEEELEESL